MLKMLPKKEPIISLAFDWISSEISLGSLKTPPIEPVTRLMSSTLLIGADVTTSKI